MSITSPRDTSKTAGFRSRASGAFGPVACMCPITTRTACEDSSACPTGSTGQSDGKSKTIAIQLYQQLDEALETFSVFNDSEFTTGSPQLQTSLLSLFRGKEDKIDWNARIIHESSLEAKQAKYSYYPSTDKRHRIKLSPGWRATVNDSYVWWNDNPSYVNPTTIAERLYMLVEKQDNNEDIRECIQILLAHGAKMEKILHLTIIRLLYFPYYTQQQIDEILDLVKMILSRKESFPTLMKYYMTFIYQLGKHDPTTPYPRGSTKQKTYNNHVYINSSIQELFMKNQNLDFKKFSKKMTSYATPDFYEPYRGGSWFLNIFRITDGHPMIRDIQLMIANGARFASAEEHNEAQNLVKSYRKRNPQHFKTKNDFTELLNTLRRIEGQYITEYKQIAKELSNILPYDITQNIMTKYMTRKYTQPYITHAVLSTINPENTKKTFMRNQRNTEIT